MSPLKLIIYFLLSLGLGVLSTYVCIVSGIDWNLAKFYNENEVFVWIAAPFVLGGMVIPFIIIGYFYFQQNKEHTGVNKVQFKRSLYAFISTYTIMTLLKVFTNRVDMEPFEPLGETDISNQFRFGFMNSNSWWESFSEGWPSGHTMIAVGMAFAIHPLIRSKFWKSLNIIYPLLVAWSVSTAFHWLSDVIAGGLIGIIVGAYIAKQNSAPLRFS